MHQFDDPAVLTEEGHFVSEKWLRLSEILQDFNPDITLNWIPPQHRTDVDRSKPYAIVHSPRNQPPYVIMFAGETDNPQEVLARIWSGDTSRQNVMANVAAMDAAEKAFKLKQEIDQREQLMDEAAWFAGTHKNWVKMKRPDGTIEKIDRTLPNGGRC